MTKTFGFRVQFIRFKRNGTRSVTARDLCDLAMIESGGIKRQFMTDEKQKFQNTPGAS